MDRGSAASAGAIRGLAAAPDLSAAASAPAAALRHLRPGSACLGEADRDRLLAARDLLAGTSAAQRAALALAHDLLDLLRCRLAVLPCHDYSVLNPDRAQKNSMIRAKSGRPPSRLLNRVRRANMIVHLTCDPTFEGGVMTRFQGIITGLASLLLPVVVLGQPQCPPPAPAPLDAAGRTAVVKAAADALRQRYVYPDVGKRAAEAIEAALAAGKYDEIVQPWAFAERLTADLREVAHDKHLNVTA